MAARARASGEFTLVVLLALLALVGIGTAVVVTSTPEEANSDYAVVTHFVDGDTFDARIDGRVERIRMLNIDTPETKDPDTDVQCLGPEASVHLASLIPVGTSVRLEYDEERMDGYGRTLAGVFTSDAFINAEMARAGLAVPVVVGENDRFYERVLDARDEAAEAGRGLFSPEVACAVPARVAATARAAEQAPTRSTMKPDATSEDLAAAAEALAPVLALAEQLENVFLANRSGHAWAVLGQEHRDRLAGEATGTRARVQRELTALQQAAAAAQQREEAAAARAAEEARQARAAEARAAEARAAEARREAPAPPKPKPKPAPKPKPKPKPKPAPNPEPAPKPKPAPDSTSSGDPYPGYTGPRCYAPGGKTWKPC